MSIRQYNHHVDVAVCDVSVYDSDIYVRCIGVNIMSMLFVISVCLIMVHA